MKRIAILTTLAVSAAMAHAAPEAYTVDNSHTFPYFTYSHFGFSSQTHRFDKTSGTVTLDRAVLIRCPDADTAARVVSASGRKATLLTDTIVEVQSEEAQAALVKKLRAAGIFIQPRGKAAKVETHIPDFF